MFLSIGVVIELVALISVVAVGRLLVDVIVVIVAVDVIVALGVIVIHAVVCLAACIIFVVDKVIVINGVVVVDAVVSICVVGVSVFDVSIVVDGLDVDIRYCIRRLALGVSYSTFLPSSSTFGRLCTYCCCSWRGRRVLRRWEALFDVVVVIDFVLVSIVDVTVIVDVVDVMAMLIVVDGIAMDILAVVDAFVYVSIVVDHHCSRCVCRWRVLARFCTKWCFHLSFMRRGCLLTYGGVSLGLLQNSV